MRFMNYAAEVLPACQGARFFLFLVPARGVEPRERSRRASVRAVLKSNLETLKSRVRSGSVEKTIMKLSMPHRERTRGSVPGGGGGPSDFGAANDGIDVAPVVEHYLVAQPEQVDARVVVDSRLYIPFRHSKIGGQLPFRKPYLRHGFHLAYVPCASHARQPSPPCRLSMR